MASQVAAQQGWARNVRGWWAETVATIRAEHERANDPDQICKEIVMALFERATTTLQALVAGGGKCRAGRGSRWDQIPV